MSDLNITRRFRAELIGNLVPVECHINSHGSFFRLEFLELIGIISDLVLDGYEKSDVIKKGIFCIIRGPFNRIVKGFKISAAVGNALYAKLCVVGNGILFLKCCRHSNRAVTVTISSFFKDFPVGEPDHRILGNGGLFSAGCIGIGIAHLSVFIFDGSGRYKAISLLPVDHSSGILIPVNVQRGLFFIIKAKGAVKLRQREILASSDHTAIFINRLHADRDIRNFCLGLLCGNADHHAVRFNAGSCIFFFLAVRSDFDIVIRRDRCDLISLICLHRKYDALTLRLCRSIGHIFFINGDLCAFRHLKADSVRLFSLLLRRFGCLFRFRLLFGFFSGFSGCFLSLLVFLFSLRF